MSLTRRDLFAAISGLGALSLVPGALAPQLARAAVTPGGYRRSNRVQDYMNNIHTLQSRFEQVSNDGGVATGTIYLSRPGKMRVEYDPPVPILLVATDNRIWYYDKKLQQVSFFALQDTPAWFLLQDNVRFGGDIKVSNLAARSRRAARHRQRVEESKSRPGDAGAERQAAAIAQMADHRRAAQRGDGHARRSALRRAAQPAALLLDRSAAAQSRATAVERGFLKSR